MQFVAVIAAVVVAVILPIAAADAGSSFVNIAEVVLVEVLAAVGDVDIPVAVLDEDADALVGEVPADVIVIGLGIGCLNRQGQGAAAQAGTVIT